MRRNDFPVLIADITYLSSEAKWVFYMNGDDIVCRNFASIRHLISLLRDESANQCMFLFWG